MNIKDTTEYQEAKHFCENNTIDVVIRQMANDMINNHDEEFFTVIYVGSWMADSHRNSITKMVRVQQREGETIKEMLDREGLSSVVFIFHGWPKLQGE